MLALSLIVIGVMLRFAPHAPNFTPVAAIALFSGAYLPKKYSIVVPLLLMAAGDLVFGLHDVVFFTWGGFALIALLGWQMKKQKSVAAIAVYSLLSALLFYLVTNFGVWAVGWYPRTLQGLATCMAMGLPFVRNFTLGTLVYSAAFFGIYAIIARLVKETKAEKVLLINKL